MFGIFRALSAWSGWKLSRSWSVSTTGHSLKERRKQADSTAFPVLILVIHIHSPSEQCGLALRLCLQLWHSGCSLALSYERWSLIFQRCELDLPHWAWAKKGYPVQFKFIVAEPSPCITLCSTLLTNRTRHHLISSPVCLERKNIDIYQVWGLLE